MKNSLKARLKQVEQKLGYKKEVDGMLILFKKLEDQTFMYFVDLSPTDVLIEDTDRVSCVILPIKNGNYRTATFLQGRYEVTEEYLKAQPRVKKILERIERKSKEI